MSRASSPPDPARPRLVEARATAPGWAGGPLLRNDASRAASAYRGRVLVAERARPDDVPRILTCCATLTVGGARLSHVSMLSREHGKPSVALDETSAARILPPDASPAVVAWSAVGSTHDPLVEGNVVFVDGHAGHLVVPAAADAPSRAALAAAWEAMLAFATGDPSSERTLTRRIDALDPPLLGFLLEGALPCRALASGEPTRRFLARVRAALGGSGWSRLADPLVERSLTRAAAAGEAALSALAATDDPGELRRIADRLAAAFSGEGALLRDLGHDGEPLERDRVRVEERLGRRLAEVRGPLARRVAELRAAPASDLATQLPALGRLLGKARSAGVDATELRELAHRLDEAAALRSDACPEGPLIDLSAGGARHADRASIGGKAEGLLRFAAVLPPGCRIADGFVVTADGYRQHLQGGVAGRLRAIVEREADLAVRSRLARATILGEPVPDRVAAAIDRACERFGEARLAVRSSATVEDHWSHSLAGVCDSFVGVHPGAELLDRVRWVWASLWNVGALRLFEVAGRSPFDVFQAVLVQRAVESVAAGVMATRDPGDADPDLVSINAAWGLGEAIAQGEVPGDQFGIRRSSGEVLHRRLGSTDRWIRLDPERRGTVLEPLPDRLRGRPCLVPAQLQRLAELARILETLESRPLTVEFGFDADGALFVFQVRKWVAEPPRLR